MLSIKRLIWKCFERKRILLTEVNWDMGKETIIFFDNLGFGWVLDSMMIKEMKLNQFKDDCTVNKSLIKILENLFDNPGIWYISQPIYSIRQSVNLSLVYQGLTWFPRYFDWIRVRSRNLGKQSPGNVICTISNLLPSNIFSFQRAIYHLGWDIFSGGLICKFKNNDNIFVSG